MKIVYKMPGQSPEIKDVPNELHALQQLVGGIIEAIPSMYMGVDIIVNEEGKLEGMMPNMFYNGDVLAGPVIFVGIDDEDFVSLEDFQAEIIMDDLNQLEV